jgi:tetratricopeptide (TPR) repeat protein
MPATVKLLERALALTKEGSIDRLEIAFELGACLHAIGELARAQALLTEAAEGAAALGDRRLELRALIELTNLHVWITPETGLREVPRVVEEALPVFESAGDDVGIACALSSLADVYCLTGRSREMGEALERALSHATRAGAERTQTRILAGLAGAYHAGPAPADEGVARLRELLDTGDAGPATRAAVEAWAIAGLEAMRDNGDQARAMCARSEAVFREFGQTGRLVDLGLYAARVEMLLDAPRAAEAYLRESHASLGRMGEKMVLATVAAELSECLYAQERLEDAAALADESAALADEEDAEAQVLWRATKAKLLARDGNREDAQRLASEAVARSTATDQPNLQGAAYLSLAEVMLLAAKPGAAAAAAGQALRAYEEKGNLVCARRAATLLDRVQATAG